jgi:DNA-binding transcriptional regulator YhcF (GntR family)
LESEQHETRRGVGTFVKARPVGAVHEKDRERELRDLEDHFLSTAARLGFSSNEALEHLRDRLKRTK